MASCFGLFFDPGGRPGLFLSFGGVGSLVFGLFLLPSFRPRFFAGCFVGGRMTVAGGAKLADAVVSKLCCELLENDWCCPQGGNSWPPRQTGAMWPVVVSVSVR